MMVAQRNDKSSYWNKKIVINYHSLSKHKGKSSKNISLSNPNLREASLSGRYNRNYIPLNQIAYMDHRRSVAIIEIPVK